MMDHKAMIREAHHRCSNDLQMVVAMLHLMARQARDDEQASLLLLEASNRVRLLAKARAGLVTDRRRSLASSLRDVCEALQVMAEPRGIVVALSLELEPDHLEARTITAVSMAVNELATNAIKHAFSDGKKGTVHVVLLNGPDGVLSITVEDDGHPLDRSPAEQRNGSGGMGLALTRRLLEDHAKLVTPDGDAKKFEIVFDKAPALQLH